MATIATRRAEMIGCQFLAISQVVGVYRYQHYETLNKVQMRMFSELNTTLLKYADQFPVFSENIEMKKVLYTMQNIEAIVTNFQKEHAGLCISGRLKPIH